MIITAFYTVFGLLDRAATRTIWTLGNLPFIGFRLMISVHKSFIKVCHSGSRHALNVVWP